MIKILKDFFGSFLKNGDPFNNALSEEIKLITSELQPGDEIFIFAKDKYCKLMQERPHSLPKGAGLITGEKFLKAIKKAHAACFLNRLNKVLKNLLKQYAQGNISGMLYIDGTDEMNDDAILKIQLIKVTKCVYDYSNINIYRPFKNDKQETIVHTIEELLPEADYCEEDVVEVICSTRYNSC